MNRILLFKNIRQDGGIRFGFDVNGVTLFEHFEEGNSEFDPALVWFLDVEIEYEGPPPGPLPQDWRTWFLSLASEINRGLDELADRLELGIDNDWLPFRHESTIAFSFLGQNIPAKIRIKGSAQKRIRNTEVAEQIRQTRRSWVNDLTQADVMETAPR